LIFEDNVFFGVGDFIPKLIKLCIDILEHLTLLFVVDISFAQGVEGLHHIAEIRWALGLQIQQL